MVEGGEFLGEFMRYEMRVSGALVIADQPHLRGGEPRRSERTVRTRVPAREVRLIAMGSRRGLSRLRTQQKKPLIERLFSMHR